jgi:hypothetical protein
MQFWLRSAIKAAAGTLARDVACVGAQGAAAASSTAAPTEGNQGGLNA